MLEAATKGDQGAWRWLVGAYGRRLFALAKSRVGRADLAEEITQSVLVTVSTKLMGGEYAEQGRFEPWLFRVAVNRIRDEVRRLKRHAEATEPEVLEGVEAGRGAGGPGAGLGGGGGADRGEVLALRAALAGLGEADREVIALRHHAGLSFAQMAEMLGEPLGTLLARHHRALRKLKAAMAGADGRGDSGAGGAGDSDDGDDL